MALFVPNLNLAATPQLPLSRVCPTICPVEAGKIVDDIRKRQIPRFASDPPAASCAHAIRELAAASGDKVRQLSVNQMELVDDLDALRKIRARVLLHECIHSPVFAETVSACRGRGALEFCFCLLKWVVDFCQFFVCNVLMLKIQ